MTGTVSDILVVETAKLLLPLKRLDSPEKVLIFIKGLGFLTSQDQQTDGLGFGAVIDLVDELDESVAALLRADADAEKATRTLELASKIPALVEQIYEAAPEIADAIRNLSESVVLGELAELLPRRILDYLVFSYLYTHHHRLYAALHLFGIVETVLEGNAPIRTVHWQRIPQLFSDPMGVAGQVYKWNVDGESFSGEKFLVRLEGVLRAFILPGGIYTQGESFRTQFGRQDGDDKEIRVPLYQSGVWDEVENLSSWSELDLNLSPVGESPPKKSGLALYPYLTAGLSDTIDLGNDWQLSLRGNLEPRTAGFALLLRAPHEVELLNNLFSEDPSTSDKLIASDFNARFEAELKRTSPEDSLTYLFGSQEGTHLAFGEAGAKVIVGVENGDAEFGGEINLQNLTICINPGGDADGFLRKVLSGVTLKCVSDFGIGLSNKDGFYFRGSSVPSVTFPAHINLGPVTIESATVGIDLEGGGIKAIMGASFSAEMGPIRASVKRMGVVIPISFPEDGKGNLGQVQILPPQFMPPSGAGLVVDMAAIKGGGYLEFDNDNKRYAGILELKFGKIGLVAIGLIATRMPDGSEGFSMVINIGVEFAPPIQLPYGFTLSGVGGLIGINRRADVDFLREGLRAKTLDSILFPKNPIQNANQIISNLRDAFPPAEGRFVVGPMIKMGWGTPNIIKADVCVLLELPEPIRVILLGQVAANFPSTDNALVSLHLDILGVLDLGKKTLSFDATLYDSRILTYALTGDAAMRLSWGENPVFALSMGGFHPAYAPPPGFPSLRRLTLSLYASPDLQLSCQAYQALTANTLQFGSRIDLYAKYAGAELTGALAFDTLIYFSPFSFQAAMASYVSATYKGHRLASLKVLLQLSGPAPWHAVGAATFSVLIWDVSVAFDETWGSRYITTIPAVNPWPLLQQALQRPEAWSAQLGFDAVEQFAPLSVSEGAPSEEETEPVKEPVAMHPAGVFEVRQNVLPLKMTLDLLGNAPVETYNSFEIKSIVSGGIEAEFAYIEEDFARAQFDKDLTNQQKLSLPSFEKFPAGARATSAGFVGMSDVVEEKELCFETITIDEKGVAPKEGFLMGLTFLETAKKQQLLDSAQLQARRAVHKFAATPLPGKVTVCDEPFVIIDKETMEPATSFKHVAGVSRTMADQVLAKAAATDAAAKSRYMVVSAYELEEVA